MALVAMISVSVSSSLRRIVDDHGPRLDVRQPVEHQALALQHARAFAARDHHDFVAGARQMRAEDGAERAGAENGKFHSVELPCSLFLPVPLEPGQDVIHLGDEIRWARHHAACEASGMRTMTVSILRSFNAW